MTPEERAAKIARQTAEGRVLDAEKRDALREGRARWRNAAEAIVTKFRQVASGDADLRDALAQSNELLQACHAADLEKSSNGR